MLRRETPRRFFEGIKQAFLKPVGEGQIIHYLIFQGKNRK